MSTKIRDRGKKKTSVFLEKAKSLTFLILKAAADCYDVFEAAGPYQSVLIHQGLEGVRRIEASKERRKVAKRADALRRRGLIEIRKVGKRLRYALTEKGEMAYLKQRLLHAPARKDGRTLLVIFDIPEQEKHARDAFRHLLKKSGFQRVQLSVWSTNKDVTAELRRWIQNHGLAKWINIYIAKKSR